MHTGKTHQAHVHACMQAHIFTCSVHINVDVYTKHTNVDVHTKNTKRERVYEADKRELIYNALQTHLYICTQTNMHTYMHTNIPTQKGQEQHVK